MREGRREGEEGGREAREGIKQQASKNL